MELLGKYIIVFITTLIGIFFYRKSLVDELKENITNRLGHVPANKIETATVYVKFDRKGKVKRFSFDPLTDSEPEIPPPY